MPIYSDILKELRKEKKLTQAQMAKRFGIAQTTYSGYESGARPMRVDMLCILADELDTSTDYILGRTAQAKPYPPRSEYKYKE